MLTSWTYTYDDAGNILSKNTYAYTTGTLGAVLDTVTYTYDTGWGDLLTGYDGKTITSDGIGNMLSDGTWTYTWKHGRQLAGMSDGTSNWTFAYDADGLRIGKTNGSTAYQYYYRGSELSVLKVGSNTLCFGYDADSTPVSVLYNDVYYFYVTNLQGDVIAIVDSGCNVVVNYVYDAWGNLLHTSGSMATTLGFYNPLRYRGYVYDQETGLYYLQSRYYNPEMGRFICADAYASTGQGILGNNMFAYCGNNPVLYRDTQGTRHEISAGAVGTFDPVDYTIYRLAQQTKIADTAGEQMQGVINGQATLPYKDESIGWGTYAGNGCGFIAVYNAMQLNNTPQSLGSITDEFKWRHGMLLWGALGITPFNIASYLSWNGIHHNGYASLAALTADISEGDILIFTVMNDKNNITRGCHVMSALYTHGEYIVFNQTNRRTESNRHPTLSDAFEGGAWIYGFRIYP